MEQNIRLDNITLNYSREGQGNPIIMMHGWGANHNTLAPLQTALAANHQTYNIDLPGFGKSSQPSEPYTIQQYVDIIKQFADTLNIKKPTLIGHSFGGRIAILYAAQHPVDHLILIDSAGVPPRHSIGHHLKVGAYKIARKTYSLLLPKHIAQQKIEQLRKKRGSDDYKNASPIMRQIMVKAIKNDLRKHMPRITAPTLLLWGENDTATPLRDAHIINRLIPNSTLITFPGASHFSYIDNPFATTAAIGRFLTK